MENGATIILESSWALNTLDEGEAQTMLCGTKGGADMLDGLRINGVNNGRKFKTVPDLQAGSVDFFEGDSLDASDLEARTFIRAVKGEGELVVRSEQAIVVTRILEGIYESAKTGKPYYFN